MLQRAASNAYSWWWASHVRAKQEKWLDENLQDMRERVKSVLCIIDDDADSFAKRAELFYKKRPELRNFVVEYHEAYRSLVEKYCHLSKDLQNANKTIATACPEQAKFGLDDEEYDARPKASRHKLNKTSKGFPDNKKFNQEFSALQQEAKTAPQQKNEEPPQVSNKSEEEDKAASLSQQEKEVDIKTAPQEKKIDTPPKGSDKFQKDVFALQTEMESVKSSYESGLTKYGKIEMQIKNMQEKVCTLQEEFSISTIIEDSEARSLVAVTALRSCQETFYNLQEVKKRSVEGLRAESQRVKDAEKKLNTLMDGDGAAIEDLITEDMDEDVPELKEQLDFGLICDKAKEYFEREYNTPLSVADLAEKIDELVNMILNLQTTVSFMTTLTKRLQWEADELENHLQGLEKSEVNLTDSEGSNEKLRQLENEFHGLVGLSTFVKDQKNKLEMGFSGVYQNLGDLHEKLNSGEKRDVNEMLAMEGSESWQDELREELQEQDELDNASQDEGELVATNTENVSQDVRDPKMDKEIEEKIDNDQTSIVDVFSKDEACLNSPDQKQSLPTFSENQEKLSLEEVSSVSENLEKIPLAEYTSVLHDYKETKRRLLEIESENQCILFDTMEMVRQLKSTNAIKEMEIQSLRDELSALEAIPDEKSWQGSNESLEDGASSSAVDFQLKNIDMSNSNSLAEEHDIDSAEERSVAMESTENPMEKESDVNSKGTSDDPNVMSLDENCMEEGNDVDCLEKDDKSPVMMPTGNSIDEDNEIDSAVKDVESVATILSENPVEEEDDFDAAEKDGESIATVLSENSAQEDEVVIDSVEKHGESITILSTESHMKEENENAIDSVQNDDESSAMVSNEVSKKEESAIDSVEKTDKSALLEDIEVPVKEENVGDNEEKIEKSFAMGNIEAPAKEDNDIESEEKNDESFAAASTEKPSVEIDSLVKNEESIASLTSENISGENGKSDALVSPENPAEDDDFFDSIEGIDKSSITSPANHPSEEADVDSLEKNDDSNETASAENLNQEEAKETLVVDSQFASSFEEKFRRDIDALLEENLHLWLRFSTSSLQIQRFYSVMEDLQIQFSKISKDSLELAAKPEVLPIIKTLMKLKVELSEWLEENALMKEELHHKNSSLSKIQHEISRTSMMSHEEFPVYEATKFQREVLNLQQENTNIDSDLQVGFSHVCHLQREVDKALSRLQKSSKPPEAKSQPARAPTTKVSLETFIHGSKPKKLSKFSLQKQSKRL